MAPEPAFQEFRDESLVVLTGDQDWAPDWALSATFEVVAQAGVPYHLFVTSQSGLFSRPHKGITLGIHPNFLPGSTHGESPDDVISACRAIAPEATSFRCHAFHENTHIMRTLVSHGFLADSNLLTFLQPVLTPLIHGTGLLRFPVFFEDDVFVQWAQPNLDLATASKLLRAPGLKILNFHPALLAMNAPSLTYYNERRTGLFVEGREWAPYHGRGVASLFTQLIDSARQAGIRFASFPEIVDRAYESMRRSYPDGLYNWSGRSSAFTDR